MKTTSCLLFMVCAIPAAASFYTVHPVPKGFDAATWSSSVSGSVYHIQQPGAADFLGNGKKQWYAGGSVILQFPYDGVISLPAITLPAKPSATVRSIAGIPMDVDGDGDPDIVRVNAWHGAPGHHTLMVFTNNGGGSFTPGWRYDFQANPDFAHGAIEFVLRAGDFDRDGDLDLATLRTWELTNKKVSPYREEGALGIHWNDGKGNFPTATTLQSTGFASGAQLDVGDLDNDGDLDLVCSRQVIHYDNSSGWDYTPPSVSTRFFDNNGTGGFTASTSAKALGGELADLNRDGWLDLVNAKSISYNRRTGLVVGGFADAVSLGGGAGDDPAMFTDADGDGNADYVFLKDSALKMWRGPAFATAQPPLTLSGLPAGAAQFSAIDIDVDGDVDFLVCWPNGDCAYVENRGHHWAPGLEPAAAGEASARALAGVTQLLAADFDRDGREDLLAVTPGQNRLWLMTGHVSGVPSAPVFKNTAGASPGGAVVADFDRDGRLDVAYTLPSAGSVRLARNAGASLFSWPDAAIATDLPGVNLIAAGELGTRDGQWDVLTSSSTTGRLRWLYRSGNGWNGQTVTDATPAPSVISARNVTARPGDEPFYLSAGQGALRVRGFELNPSWKSIGDHAQAITASAHFPVMAWGDMNADGKDDVVFARGDGALAFWTPGSPINLSMGAAPGTIRAIETVDWDRDGRTDVLCATSSGLCLYLWKNGWQREMLDTREGGYTALKVLHLDRDGWPDVAAATATHIHFLKNAPRLLRAAATLGMEAVIPAGQAADVIQAEARHPGRNIEFNSAWLGDGYAAVTGAVVEFRRAEWADGQWKPGAPLSKTELASVVYSATLLSGGKTIGSSGAAALGGGGRLSIDYHAVLGNLLPFGPATAQTLQVRLQLMPGAAQSAHARFFVSLPTMKGRVLDDVSGDVEFPVSTGATSATLVSAQSMFTPLQQWRQKHFGAPDGSGSRANDQDFDKDGVPNLLEYALGTNPAAAEPALNEARALALLPAATAQSPVKFRLIADDSALADSKVRLTVQRSTGLDDWTALATSIGGGAWNGLAPTFVNSSGGATAFEFTTAFTPQNTKQLFLRLLAEELP